MQVPLFLFIRLLSCVYNVNVLLSVVAGVYKVLQFICIVVKNLVIFNKGTVVCRVAVLGLIPLVLYKGVPIG